VLTDLHVGSPHHGIAMLRRIVSAVNREQPDAVLILGDIVIQGVLGGRFVPPEEVAPVLGQIESRFGSFAVLGNHDWWLDGPRVAAVAGHTHGGQVNLPLIGRPIVPSQFGQRYAAGHIIEHARNLFVSTGLGTSILPIRFRVPPEIVVLTVRRNP
jgi:hypothetical protein